jgi:hypothetical protein
MTPEQKQAKHEWFAYELLKRLAEDVRNEIDWAEMYGDPGYTQPRLGVVKGNWNRISRRVQDYLEAVGYALEWCDEWDINWDSSPIKMWRIAPDSYHWQPNAIYTEDGLLTRDDDPKEWIDYAAVDAPTDRLAAILYAWTTEDDLAEQGFELYAGQQETGWHPGQTDDPAKVMKQAFADKTVRRIVFRQTEQSQFYMRWEAWVERESVEEQA